MAARRRGAKLTKTELVNQVAKGAGLTKAQAHRAVDSMLNSIRSTLAKGASVNLVGFGSFVVVQRKARKGRNPRTGKVMTIPARKVVRFRPGRQLRELFK